MSDEELVVCLNLVEVDKMADLEGVAQQPLDPELVAGATVSLLGSSDLAIHRQ
jgi:hypothetical protein